MSGVLHSYLSGTKSTTMDPSTGIIKLTKSETPTGPVCRMIQVDTLLVKFKYICVCMC